MGAHALVVFCDLGINWLVSDGEAWAMMMTLMSAMSLTPECLSSKTRLGFMLPGSRALSEQGRLIFRKR